jgi:IS30 family transposase
MKKKPKLNQFERDRIQALLLAGHSQKEIARVIGRDKGTISREIANNSRKDGIYNARYAQHLARVKRIYAKYQGKKINENNDLKKWITNGLLSCWNPDEISGRMREENLPFYASKTAIYEWLYSAWGQKYCILLPSKQYHPKKRKEPKTAGREMIPNRVGIEERPLESEYQMGHLEHDNFVSGKKTGSKVAVSVLLEPKAGYIVLAKIPNQRPGINEGAVQTMLNIFKNPRSITRDNGLENRYHELTAVGSYFCDPYSSWQKPSVENAIKLLRRFFKKGSDLDRYSDEEISFVQNILNNKPRKSLGYKTPLEIMVENDMIRDVENKNQEVVLRDIINNQLVAIEG